MVIEFLPLEIDGVPTPPTMPREVLVLLILLRSTPYYYYPEAYPGCKFVPEYHMKNSIS